MTQQMDDERLEQARANTEPISALADTLVTRAVAREAQKTGRTVAEQWERMGDGFAYQAAEQDPNQKQLDDHSIHGETVKIEP